MRRIDVAVGCLLGTAVGDALGLACEGLSRRRQRRWFASIDGYRLIGNKGMCSDDTEHSCMVAQALLVSGGDPAVFARSFAWRLRWWLAGLPAGIGFATLRAILKLWLFIPPHASGVWSAGNGPAMRSALIGVCLADDPAALRALVRASTRITHRDPKAECGALAVALAARASAEGALTPLRLIADLRDALAHFGDAGAELLSLAERAAESAARGEETAQFADSIGCANGVSGYMYHSVPAVLQACFRHPHDYALAITGMIRCGGDSDTTGAMVGAIVGAGVGKAGIPPRWLDDLWEWPRSVRWMEELASKAARGVASNTPFPEHPLPVAALALRNLGFFLLVLAHGFRRLGPPY